MNVFTSWLYTMQLNPLASLAFQGGTAGAAKPMANVGGTCLLEFESPEVLQVTSET